MDEIIPGLWLGGISSAGSTEELKICGIRSVLSVMRGHVVIHPTFISNQIALDDDEDEDILSHLIPAISFITAELEKGHGVLVHCHEGISRSATVVAAYLMYSRNMAPDAALALIRKSRREISPNDGFLRQLDIFHQASFSLSNQDKATRMFYLERAVKRIKSGKTPDLSSLPDFSVASAGAPQSPQFSPRRRIRCKMCRQELASREHMLGHGIEDPVISQENPPVLFNPSLVNVEAPLVASGRKASDELSEMERVQSGDANSPAQDATEAIETESTNPRSKHDARLPHIQQDDRKPEAPSLSAASTSRGFVASQPQPPMPPTRNTPLSDPTYFSAQLHANPTLAALRTGTNATSRSSPLNALSSPPILADSKCSGYFVEPMKWMDTFLESGQLVGKIICPNKKCGAKLGNYDWAGVHCSCKEWVVPGFCIHRSKVDEFIV